MKRTLLNIAIASCLSSGLFAAEVMAGNVGKDQDHTVQPGDAVEDWMLNENSILNVMPGAEVGQVWLDNWGDSTLIMQGGKARELRLWSMSSRVVITNSVISNLSGSGILRGPDMGGDYDYVTLDNTQIEANVGILTGNGEYLVSNGSYVKGNQYGMVLRPASGFGVTAIIDNSTVEGVNDSAIYLREAGRTTTTSITVQNNSKLLAGNGVILRTDSDFGGHADLAVDNSQLSGDIIHEGDGSLDVTLRNYASLTGNITNATSLSLESGGTWKLLEDGSVGELKMNGGIVDLSKDTLKGYRFGDEGEEEEEGEEGELPLDPEPEPGPGRFKKLTAASLSGNGTFLMSTDLNQGEGSKLIVTGNATGSHILHVLNTGGEPTSGSGLDMVSTGGGDASFSVTGGAVDMGIWKYYLNKHGNSWLLEPTLEIEVPGDQSEEEGPGEGGEEGEGGSGGEGGGTGPVTPPPTGGRQLSNSARAVLALDAAVENLWYGENTPLSQRMYAVRGGETNTGMWSSAYARDIRAQAGEGTDYRQSLSGFQIGGDRQVYLNNQPLLLGAFAGYSNSSLKLDAASSGRYESQYAGAYGNWFSDSGWYASALLKADHVTVKARPVMSDGSGTSGRYSQNLFGGQLEGGKKIRLGEEGFITPYAKVATLHASGYDYQLDNGMQAHSNGRNSVQGSVGATIGINHKLDNGGTLSPYVRVAAVQEFANGNGVNINGLTLDNSTKGTRAEVGGGVSWQVSEKVSLTAEVDYARGEKTERNWGGSAGFEYRF